jgi:glycosyltransferase involved in cell wall biosynthesis
VKPQEKIRILHIFRKMDRGGAETWVVNVLRTIDRSRFQFDFLVESDDPGAYDDEIRALGGRIYVAGSSRHLGRYLWKAWSVIRAAGPYDVVHSHAYSFSGFLMAVGKAAGIPVRIAHSHNDLRRHEPNASRARRLYLSAMRCAINIFSTVGLAASSDAARSLFGERWDTDSRNRVLHCGIDLEGFSKGPDETVRAELGIPADAVVICHIGSFSEQKNHPFILKTLSYILSQQPNVTLLLVGEGTGRKRIERLASEIGITDNIRFLGTRPDVPRILRGAADCFIFPSLHEGLGLALIEAQAAGVPCVVSDVIPDEADVIPSLVHRMSLDQAPSDWADAVLAVATKRLDSAEALDVVSGSSFNIQASTQELAKIYAGGRRDQPEGTSS